MRGVRGIVACSALIVMAIGLFGCTLLDALIGNIGSGRTGTPVAIITAMIDDGMVTSGLNPDMRPPLTYAFSTSESLDSDGIPLPASPSNFDYAWDFGNGSTLGPGGYPNPSRIFFLEQGTYDVVLTLSEWGGGTATATERIVVGEPWLEIMEITWAPRPDGLVGVSVAVRNRSAQPLKEFSVRLKVDGEPVGQLGANLVWTEPDRLLPGGGYILSGAVNPWAGELTAVSYFCTPWE